MATHLTAHISGLLTTVIQTQTVQTNTKRKSRKTRHATHNYTYSLLQCLNSNFTFPVPTCLSAVLRNFQSIVKCLDFIYLDLIS